jgi:hypothetical protein
MVGSAVIIKIPVATLLQGTISAVTRVSGSKHPAVLVEQKEACPIIFGKDLISCSYVVDYLLKCARNRPPTVMSGGLGFTDFNIVMSNIQDTELLSSKTFSLAIVKEVKFCNGHYKAELLF